MAKKKTKVRKAQATKQRKAAKRNARRKQYLKTKARNQMGSVSAEEKLAKMILDFENSSDYLFWIGHGLNMLASSYKEGTWTPVFPDLYGEGRQITEDEISAYIMGHYDKETNTWTSEGRCAVGWANSTVVNIYSVQQKCLAEAQKNSVDPNNAACDPRAAACGPVWRIFGIMRDEIEKRMGNQHLTTEPTVEP